MRRALLVAVLALCLSGCEVVPIPQFEAPNSQSPSVASSPGTAAAVLETLPLKGRAPMTGYSRSVFMPHGWEDPDGNGCARVVAVKAKFRLWLKPAERDAIARVLASCPGQQVPA